MNKLFLTAVTVGALMAVGAAQINVGYREARGINVGAGETATQEDAVQISDGGELLKIGKGKLTMPVKAVDQNADSTVKVLEGTLELTADDGPDSNPLPSVLVNDATLWLDITGNGVVTTNGEGETESTQYLARWCDRREENPDSPTRYYVDPTWNNHTESELWGVPPVKTEAWGRTTAYFGGAASSQRMTVMKNGAASPITGVRDYFIVFGVTNCLGQIIGAFGGECLSAFFNVNFPKAWPKCGAENLFYMRNWTGSSAYSGRTYLDGAIFDPYRYGIQRGFQLLGSTGILDGCTVGHVMDGYASITSGSNIHMHEGGDYVSEVILFTKILSETERLQVERYLMKKWQLPHHYYERDCENTAHYDMLPMQTNFTTVATSTNGTLIVNADEGEVTKAIRLSGEGKVVKRGKGAMEIGPSGAIPFNGEFKLEEGTVRLRGGLPPALDLTAGQRLTSVEKRFTDADAGTREGQREAMTEISLATVAGSTTVTKEGVGPARVRSLDAGVKRLRVNKGQLVIDPGVKQRSLRATGTANSISVDIPNSGFETYFTRDNPKYPYSNFGYVNTHTATCGWNSFALWSNEDYLSSATNADGSNDYSIWCSYAPPEGTNVLCIISGSRCGVYTTIRFPVDGYYQMSVHASHRTYWNNVTACDVFLGETLATTNVFGTIVTDKAPFHRFYCKTPFVKAGQDYVFGFRIRDGMDSALLLDDVHLDYIASEERLPTAYAIPNGDFELASASILNYYRYITNEVTIANWTLNGKLVNGAYNIGRVTPATRTWPAKSDENAGRAHTAGDVKWNSGQLFMCGKASAETTFTPPAGTYRVRGLAACWQGKFYGYDTGTTETYLTGYVTIGGKTTSLGYSQPFFRHKLTQVIFPDSFTVDGTQAVTLKLAHEYTDACFVILDDFDLIAGTDWSDVELLKDPETEMRVSAWSALDPALPKIWKAQTASTRFYAGMEGDKPKEYYWGFNRFQGDKYFMLVENGAYQQEVKIPVAGTYRVTYHERSRLGGCGANPLSVWMSSGAYTNFIARSTRFYATNYVEYAYTFQLPKAGTYKLVFAGNGYNKSYYSEDLEEMLDGVSLRYVPDEAIETPSLSEDLMVYVEKGAILCLNFPGTVTTGPVKLGGVTVTGEVSAKTYPDYITGNGKLNAQANGGDGFLIIVR